MGIGATIHTITEYALALVINGLLLWLAYLTYTEYSDAVAANSATPASTPPRDTNIPRIAFKIVGVGLLDNTIGLLFLDGRGRQISFGKKP